MKAREGKRTGDVEMDAQAVVSAVMRGCLHTQPVITWNSFSSAQSGRAEIISHVGSATTAANATARQDRHLPLTCAKKEKKKVVPLPLRLTFWKFFHLGL